MAGLTQEQLADSCGYSADYVGKLERGQRHPPVAALRRVAVVLGLEDGETTELLAARERRAGEEPGRHE
jgi:transcriptional regulator with XRE-family HTH domain